MTQSLIATVVLLMLVKMNSGDTTWDYGTVTAEAPLPPTTTAVPYPDLPPPYIYIEMQFPNAVNPPGITTSCIGQYSVQFQSTLKDQLNRAKGEMLSDPTFCPGTLDATLALVFSSANGNYNETDVIFAYDISPVGANTLSQVSNCGWQLSAWMSNYNNWRQPIWSRISGCPELIPVGPGFVENGIKWSCPS